MLGKVLLLSASAGAGHVRAAQALENALRETGAATEFMHIDALEYTNKLFRKLYADAYIEMVNKAPELFGWFYDRLDKPWQNERRRLALDKLNTRKLVRLLKTYNPDVTISTHFLPAEIIAWLRAKERINTRQAIVVTDFDVHAMWLVHHFEQYFVALDESRVYLEKLGIPASKITVSGVPIDPAFAIKKDRFEMREKHGLRKDLDTVLVSAGGLGVGPVEQTVKGLLELESESQVVVVCGRNEELKERISRVVSSHRNLRVAIHPVGFTTEMDELMAASDILVGKPGGLTTAEGLARGLAFVIVNPVPGQEERNSDHLLERGAAVRCNNLPVLAYKIARLLSDRSLLARMQSAAREMSRPRAAFTVIEKLSNL